jgi:hypothetical protein
MYVILSGNVYIKKMSHEELHHHQNGDSTDTHCAHEHKKKKKVVLSQVEEQ